MTLWARDEVRMAFAHQLRERSARIGGGAASLGWKLGAGSPAAMARLDIEGPLIGYLLDSGQIASGGAISVAGWTNARIETEIAVRIDEPPAPDAPRSDRSRAIAAIALAFELVDVDSSRASAEAMLRRNVFHRALVLGEWVPARAVPPVNVALDDALVTDAADPIAAVGDLAELVGHVAEVLAVNDTPLAAGSVILTGAVALPPPVVPGQRWTASAPELGQIEISIVS